MKPLKYFEVTKTHLTEKGYSCPLSDSPETVDGLKIMVLDISLYNCTQAHNPYDCAICGTPYTPAQARARVEDPLIYRHVSP